MAVDALQVRNLQVRYHSIEPSRPAIDSVDLTVRAGEIVGITGPVASGKSTLAYALLGLTRETGRITGGEVIVGGEDLMRVSAERQRAIRGRQIALIVQNPRASLDPLCRVGLQIDRVAHAHADDAAVATAIDLLRLVGINDPERRARAFAHELSGGMAQRVLIAIALAASPRVLVADEPTSGLDVTVQAQFLDLMWQKAKELGMALVLISQEPGILVNYCDRVVSMTDGRIVSDRSIAAYAQAEVPLSSSLPATRIHVSDSIVATRPVLVEVCRLVKEFVLPRDTAVVHAVGGVSFSIQGGETLGLVGESGSGKTTVGRCLLGLERPTAGEIVFESHSLGAMDARQMRKLRARLQVVHQDPRESLDPRWTIQKSLTEPLDLHSMLEPTAKRARIEELLHWVGCGMQVMAMRPQDLGASELQRLNIARALATDPSFIVLDEPTSQLSPGARGELVELLNRLQKERGLSYLFISHDLTTVRNLCHRVAVMYLGQIVEVAATQVLYSAARHPYTRALLSCHLDTDLSRRRVDRPQPDGLRGEIPSPINLPTGCYLASRCPRAEARCRSETQELREVGPGHWVRCWRSEDP